MWLLTLLLGCQGEITPGETEDTELTDTEPACTEVALGAELVVLEGLTMPEEPLTMALLEVDLSEGLEIGEISEQWSAGVLGDGDAFTLCLPETVEALTEVDEDVSVAAFMLGAWADDGDEEPDEGDVFVGASMTLLAYVEGTNDDVETLGGEPGWNLMVVEIEQGPTELIPFVDGDDGFLLQSNLLPALPTALEAVVRPDLDGTYLAELHSLLGIGTSDAPDEPGLVSVSFTSNGRDAELVFDGLPVPPDAHFDDELGPTQLDGALVAPYVGVAFDDDGDGAFAFGEDELLAYSTGQTSPRMAVYVQAIGFGAVYFGATASHTGWMLLGAGESPGLVDWDEGLVLDEAGD